MGSFAGKCEVVEENEDQQRPAVYSGRTIWPPSGLSIVDDKDLERPVLKLGYKGSLEDDINQLFESISIRTSGMVPSYDFGPSTSRNTSPLGRNALKRPVNPGAQRPPSAAPAESAMLKQALRDLCISKASETAAMKRVPKTSGSPGCSEAGRLKNLYGSVLVESGSGTRLANEEGKAVLVELLREGKNSSPESISQQLHALKISSSSQSAQMSPQYPVQTNRYHDGTMLRQHGVDSVSRSAGYQESKTDILRKDDDLYAYLESHRNAEDEALGLDRNVPSSSRSGSEIVVGLKSVRRVRLLYANTPTATIVNGRRVAKLTRTVPRTAKPALRNKPSVKKKAKQFTSLANVYDEVDGFYDPIAKQLLCHRCHSALKNAAAGEACEDSHVSSNNMIAHVDEVDSDDLNSGVKYPGSEEAAQDFCCSGYENSNAINTGAENNQGTVRRPLDVNTNAITSSAETNHPVSLASAFVNNDAAVDPVGFRYGPKNAKKDSGEISFSIPSGKEVDQQDTLFMSDQNVEIGSFSERSVVMNPDSPPNEPNIDGTIIEEDNENQTNRGIIGEFPQSANDIIKGNSTSTSMSEEEEESNASRSSFGNRPHMLKDMRWEAIQHIRMQHGSIGLRHFNLLKKLGCGDIGTVYLAELTSTDCMFAIKVMDNEFLARRNKMPRAQTERDILRMLDHPFLPTLYSHFTSDNLSCLVMECCPGGDLHVLRQKQPSRCFPEPAARFYVAEVLLALEYLHMLGVIYRDLKPENILVREDGHIMVTDFDLSLRCSVSPTLLSSSSPLHTDAVRHSGQSNCIEPWCIQPSLRVSCFRPRLLRSTKKGKTKRMRKLKKSDLIASFRSLPQLVAEPTDARSNSFVGTHEYLAPEIIKGEGHGAAVDWWTFGIFLYELLYGRTPFKGSTNEETLGNVVLQNLKFPDNQSVSFQARDLIRGWLVKEPEIRLGTGKGAAEIKRHPFFEGLNWALIRCAIPPELPELYEYGPSNHESKGNYLECKAIGKHLEFDLF